jgi:hypothetical protein
MGCSLITELKLENLISLKDLTLAENDRISVLKIINAPALNEITVEAFSKLLVLRAQDVPALKSVNCKTCPELGLTGFVKASSLDKLEFYDCPVLNKISADNLYSLKTIFSKNTNLTESSMDFAKPKDFDVMIILT